MWDKNDARKIGFVLGLIAGVLFTAAAFAIILRGK